MKKLILVFFLFSVVGCLGDIKTPEYNIKSECKKIYLIREDVATDACKYTNESGGFFCASGFPGTAGMLIPCDFFEGLK